MGRDYVYMELKPLTDPIVHPPICTRVNMEQRWNVIERGKPKDSERNLSKCHFEHSKSNMDCLGANPVLRGKKPSTNRLSYGTALHTIILVPYFSDISFRNLIFWCQNTFMKMPIFTCYQFTTEFLPSISVVWSQSIYR
jgi:hypothetical protein